MKLLGLRYHNLERQKALLRCLKLVADKKEASVFFLNLDCLYKACRDRRYRAALKKASLVLPDGVGLRIATALFGGRMRDNCNGTDLCPRLLRKCAQLGLPIFLLGGKEGVAHKAAQVLRSRYPEIKIAGTCDGYFQPEDEDCVIAQVNNSGAQVLLVGFGAPLQEKWIFKNRSRLKPVLCLGVGALLDWISGTQPRAPAIVRKFSLEWAWRIAIEPQRMFRRYLLDDLPFLAYLAGRRVSQTYKRP